MKAGVFLYRLFLIGIVVSPVCSEAYQATASLLSNVDAVVPSQSSLQQSDIDAMDKQIKEAETELVELKRLLETLKPGATADSVAPRMQRIIHLNRGLADSYNKKLAFYREQGIQGTPELNQALKGQKMAERGVLYYTKKLKKIEPVLSAAYPAPGGHGLVSTPELAAAKARQAITAGHGAPASASDDLYKTEAFKSAHGWHATPPPPPAAPADHGAAASHGAPPAVKDSVFESEAFKSAHGWHASGAERTIFQFTPFGYIQTEASYVTRQIAILQEFQPFIVPVQPGYDSNNRDVNDRSQFLTFLHAHMGSLITGPKVLDASLTGDISFEFYSPFQSNYVQATDPGIGIKTAGFLLVHATMYLEWQKTILLLGQTWHPDQDPEVSVARDRVTILGAVADPNNRLFQIRVTQKVIPEFKLIMAVLTNIDNKARQNSGISPEQFQNPTWYNFHFQGRAQFKKHIFALAADIQTEQPRLFEDNDLRLDIDKLLPIILDTPSYVPPIRSQNTQVRSSDSQAKSHNESTRSPSPGITFYSNRFGATKRGVTSFSIMAFAKVEFERLITKAKLIVGSSLSHPLGGFGIVDPCTSEVAKILGDQPQRPLTKNILRFYDPARLVSLSADFSTNQKLSPGVYIGFVKNLGFKNKLWPYVDDITVHDPTNPKASVSIKSLREIVIFKYASDIDYTVTVSPRIKWLVAPMTFSAEVECTQTSFGNVFTNEYGAVNHGQPINSIRFILSAYFNF
ncbi:MAG: hypothetical protein NTX86_00330 [Candidatus Dependentiae bacterium]|nr:hypothetical protein [Candidatus Dependentiae bacterium]